MGFRLGVRPEARDTPLHPNPREIASGPGSRPSPALRWGTGLQRDYCRVLAFRV